MQLSVPNPLRTDTMKLHILSDLHNTSTVFRPPAMSHVRGSGPDADSGADVVVLAGDIDKGRRAIEWASSTFACPVIAVAGNHEHDDDSIEASIQAMRNQSFGTNVRFLERDVAIVGNVRFVGATLWTDFKLFGEQHAEAASLLAGRAIPDFRRIRHKGGLLQPAHTQAFFDDAVRFIGGILRAPFDGQTVVVTHHAPSPKSVHPRYVDDTLSAAFCSNLERLMDGTAHGVLAPDLWLHGHSHLSWNYRVGRTRVIANPRGYTKDDVDGQENDAFDPGLIVTI